MDAATVEGKLYNVFWRISYSFGGVSWDGAFLLSVTNGQSVVSSPL